MRKLIVPEETSLDSVVQSPGDPGEDRSGDTVRQLLVAGLVDELWLLICPVILGRGMRLFGDNAQASAFTLANSNSTPRGVLITSNVRSGEVRAGRFEEVE